MGKLVVSLARILLFYAVVLLSLTMMLPDIAFAQHPVPTPTPPLAIEGSSSGIFINPIPAGAVVSGVGTNSFTMGIPREGTPPSSLIFVGAPFTTNLEEVFSLGTLTFFNGEVQEGTFATSVDLAITITLTTPAGITKELTQTLTLVNTPNTDDLPAGADVVFLPTTFPEITFEIEGIEHALVIKGFGSITGDGGATTIDRFFVLEGGTASAELLGIICAPSLREPCGSNAQPVYSREIPQGLAPNLIVIVHGCCTDENDLEEWRNLKSSIDKTITANQTPGAWEIVVWDWTNVTKIKLPDAVRPDFAYLGAVPYGQYLGKEIVNPSAKPEWKYNYVHFISHSAGSRLIHEAAKYIKTKDTTPPFIHSTFLDAYCHPPFPVVDAVFYAYYSDYAEQYVDRGLPLTDLYLWAYNFDVTHLQKPVLGTEFPSGYGWSNGLIHDYHFWAVDWYQQSIDKPSEFGFGFRNSFEYNRNAEDPETFYDRLKQDLKLRWNISAGDVCVLTSNTECGSPGLIAIVPPPIVDYTPLLSSWIIGGMGTIQKSITGVVETIEDNVGGWLATLFTGSPVWFEAPITTTQTFNLLKFDYEFLSTAGAQGILTVFVDDQLVYAIDERITDPVGNTALDIPVGELTPGAHTIGVRLDPFTDVQSVMQISNIEFGEVVDTPIPETPNLHPTEITFDPPTVGVGDTVFFDSGVRNTGDVDTDIFNIQWLVNGQDVGAAGSHAGVPAGQTVMDSNSQFSWMFDSPGTYSVTFTVDFDNQIEESNEGDNSTTIDVVVGQSPPPPPPPPGLSPRCQELLVGETCGSGEAYACISLRIAVGGTCQGACADEVYKAIRAEGISIASNGPDPGPEGFSPACVAFIPSIGGTAEGAQCLVDFLGHPYQLEDLGEGRFCSSDGFPYNVYIE